MKNSLIRAFLILAISLLCCGAGNAEENTKKTSGEAPFSIWFMNTGKSDCILIKSGEHAVMVDTGLAYSAPTMLGVLRASGITRLDAVFLTHTDKDHIGGLKALLANIPVEKVYRATISETEIDGENKIDEISEEAGKRTTLLNVGDNIRFTDSAWFSVLAPITYNEEDENDNSLVMMLEANGTRVLLTGDMLFSEEETVLSSGANLSADILKVAHHGRTDATSEAFLDAVSPKYAVILTDRFVKEKTAHPLLLDELENREITYYITDETVSGVRFSLDPEKKISVDFPLLPESCGLPVTISLDHDEQCLTMKNTGNDRITLEGCILYSEKKDNIYVFPENAVIEAGAAITLTGTKGEGMLIWPDVKKPFPKEGDGIVVLYDMYGNLLTALD